MSASYALLLLAHAGLLALDGYLRSCDRADVERLVTRLEAVADRRPSIHPPTSIWVGPAAVRRTEKPN